MEITLRTSARTTYLDDLLRGLIMLFEMAFPTRIRSYYLGGSASDGTTVGNDRSPNASDIDMFIIFHGSIQETEHTTFQGLIAASQLISPMQVDAHAYSELDLLHRTETDSTQMSFLNALIKVAGVLVYGDDISAELPPVPLSHYILDVIESGLFHLAIPRARAGLAYPLITPLVPPLTYPDPAGEFYGYDNVPAHPNAPRGTRVLVALTGWIATLILALETGRFAAQKSQSIQLCMEHLPDDGRTQLAASIYRLCKGTWGYTLPTTAEDRERLRSLCHDTLVLENTYLKLCHDYLLSQLQQSGTQEQRRATRILQNVVYRDKEITSLLQELASE